MSKARKESTRLGLVTRGSNRLVKAFTVRTALTIGMLTILFTFYGCMHAVLSLPPPKPIDTFTDSRDGRTYRTVEIGRFTWMAENLNFTTNGSWCLENDVSNCVAYGRLYTWESAMSACPAGWRLPDTAAWSDLIQTAGGKKQAGKTLKSRTGWKRSNDNTTHGIDYFGFSALPGHFNHVNFAVRVFGAATDAFNYGGTCRRCYGHWWSSTNRGRGVYGAYALSMHWDEARTNMTNNTRGFCYSVRCVRE